MKKLLVGLTILISSQSLLAGSWHQECITEWSSNIKKALEQMEWSMDRDVKSICTFSSAKQEYGRTYVTYCCDVPNFCSIRDCGDEAAMGHSEYYLSCR